MACLAIARRPNITTGRPDRARFDMRPRGRSAGPARQERSGARRVGLGPAAWPVRGEISVQGRHSPIAMRQLRRAQGTLRSLWLFAGMRTLDLSATSPAATVPPAGEEETMRGRNTEPVELRPGST